MARWNWSWPAYEAWFVARGGDAGPNRAACEAALMRYMPELAPVHAALVRLTGGDDRAARFLSTWCPPPYLGGCSLAARSEAGVVRLVRNYDLSPELNEGLLLRSEWTGTPVMGMIEFLWGVSDGVNEAGLAVALAFGGWSEVREGFGVTTILRYVLETCTGVPDALAVLARIPSHMAYNVVLADRTGTVTSVELIPGGGMRRMERAIATNHQHGAQPADRPGFTKTVERRAHLEVLLARATAPDALAKHFLAAPLLQHDYDRGFGTLFTAEYDPVGRSVALRWPGEDWHQSLGGFSEGSRTIRYMAAEASFAEFVRSLQVLRPYLAAGSDGEFDIWLASAREGTPDWTQFGTLFTSPPRHPQAQG